jgi:hypothetical protein
MDMEVCFMCKSSEATAYNGPIPVCQRCFVDVGDNWKQMADRVAVDMLDKALYEALSMGTNPEKLAMAIRHEAIRDLRELQLRLADDPEHQRKMTEMAQWIADMKAEGYW